MRKCAAAIPNGIASIELEKVSAEAHAGMDLLLTHGYFLADDPKEREIMKPYAPLGLLYLSSHLRARGFDVEIYDSTFGSREELLRVIETERPARGRDLRQSDDAARMCSPSRRRRARADAAWCSADRSRRIIRDEYLSAGRRCDRERRRRGLAGSAAARFAAHEDLDARVPEFSIERTTAPSREPSLRR